jgi:putative thiazole-containing bacteriocin maturation protein
MYVSQMINSYDSGFPNQTDKVGVPLPEGFLGIGSGETTAEAVCRGLQAFLDEELEKRKPDHLNKVFRVSIGAIEDKRCRFYLNALTTLNGAPTIGLKEDVLGFPTICVRSNGCWYTGTGLNSTLALQNTLQQALLNAQNRINSVVRQEQESMIYLEKEGTKLEIPSCDDMTQLELLQSSIQVLNRNAKKLVVYDLSVEPFLKQELAGVYGVQVREGDS